MEKPFYIKNIKNTEVKKSNVHGYGLFATADIKKGTLLCNLSGQIISKDYFDKILQSKKYDKEILIERTFVDDDKIMMIPFRTCYGYINHNKDGISHIREEFIKEKNIVMVYANMDIKIGEEIFDTYNLKKHIDLLDSDIFL